MCNKKSFITFALTAVLLLTAGMGCCAANVEETLDVEISAPEIFYNGDVIFAKYDEWPQTTLRMDICGPDDGKKHPAVVLIPGGAWLASPKDAWSHVAFKLAENGFVAASIEYRLIGAASYAEIIGDAKAAVRFLRAHADKFHIDKDKIAVMVGGRLSCGDAGRDGGRREIQLR